MAINMMVGASGMQMIKYHGSHRETKYDYINFYSQSQAKGGTKYRGKEKDC